MNHHEKIKKFAVFFLIIMPAILLLDFDAVFYGDFQLHSFLWGYSGLNNYLNSDSLNTINSKYGIGLVSTFFYSPVLSKFVNIFSNIHGIGYAIRILVLLAYLFQFFCFYKLFSCLKINKYWALCIPIIFCQSTYPMTNLYNRGALPEFFAIIILSSLFALILIVSFQNNVYKRFYYSFLAAISFILIIGSHPITALYGLPAIFLMILFLYFSKLIQIKKIDFIFFGFLGICSLLILAPLLSIAYYFDMQLQVHSYVSDVKYLKYFDHWLVRLLPFPFDPRHFISINKHEVLGGTPYHDTNMNSLILFLALYLFFKNFKILISKKTLLIYFSAFTIAFIIIGASIWPNGFMITSFDYFNRLQAAYRLTGICNIVAIWFLITTIILLQRNNVKFTNQKSKNTLTIILIFSTIFCAYKLNRGVESMIQESSIGYHFSQKPSNNETQIFYSKEYNINYWSDYTTNTKYNSVNEITDKKIKDLNFETDIHNFNQVLPETILIDEPTIVKTNVLAFPWNKIILNGKIINDNELFGHGTHNQLLAFLIEKNNFYTIEYKLEIPNWYLSITKLSNIFTNFYIFLFIALTLILQREYIIKRLKIIFKTFL